jgi:RimJ/RimL family protein N-acetyltransferase
VPEVWAVLYPDNERSAAVARRLGMEPQGLTTRWYGVELLSFRAQRPAADPGGVGYQGP